VLFVAREPDETLRTFLPVIDVLRRRFSLASTILFHHQPGAWATDELRQRGVPIRTVDLPDRTLPRSIAEGRFGDSSLVRTSDEVLRFWRARKLARTTLAQHRPCAVVVIQDTLLLERFIVRLANRRGLPTLVVQWAFSFPQAMYDRLRAIQHGRPTRGSAASPNGYPRLVRPLTRAGYRAVLSGLGLSFDLANSYGGGEARWFAVMGQAFKEQYIAQGVRDKEIVVTGHPMHDAAFRRRERLTEAERATLRRRYGLPEDRPIVVYATQPVLWRRVMTEQQLRENVEAIASAVSAAPGNPLLVLKLHPRESPDQYAFCGEIVPPIRVIAQADMTDLIAVADAFVSSSSSTVLLAMMLDRPIVTANFSRVPHFDSFEPIGGTLHTRTGDEFRRAIAAALADDATRGRLAGERSAVLERYTRFDGAAAERIARLLHDAVISERSRAVAG
jgi:hypothetical protein